MTNKRYRRLRSNEAIRNLVAETRLTGAELIQPYFVIEGKGKTEAIHAMPGIKRYTIDRLLPEIESYMTAGGRAGLFFGLPAVKDETGASGTSAKSIVPKAVAAIKKKFPDFTVITDVCLCAYLKHGHCGILKGRTIDNDATLPVLTKMALAHAEAGADIVAPSDMMDHRVAVIRAGLDKNGFSQTPILSYAVKYASALYGPFREAADSAPSFGDRKSYQMDYANAAEALKEARQDLEEGADILMVKPAVAYLDVIALLKRELNVPVAAYHVSGEYSMIKAAAENGWIDEEKIVAETLTSIKRAGASMIFTYYAHEFLSRQSTKGGRR